ncbi:MAG: DUF2812 domain-containing protein [Lachnospiraceae bacterium]|nr:DUF2812 domain-containing protein [Lachnospiraceae bacterium]
MNELKHRLEFFSFYDHSGIEKHLGEMAEKGWLLKEIKRVTWVYRRIKPKKLHFAVTYYPNASDFDPEPQEGQMIYRDYSEYAGWKFVCQSAQMQIFYNEEEEPIPLETDPVVEVQTIHKAAKKSFLLPHFIILGLSILQAALFISRLLDDPIGLLSSTTNLSTGFCWVLLFLLCVIELCGYYRWHNKAVKAAENGEFLETHSHTLFHRMILAASVFLLVYQLINMLSTGKRMMLTIYVLLIGYMITLIAVVNAVTQFLKRKKVSRGANLAVTLIVDFALAFAMIAAITFGTLRASQSGLFHPEEDTYEYGGMTFILYQDEIPLSVGDLQDIDFDGYIRESRESESIFLGQRVVHQWPRHDTSPTVKVPSLSYTLTIIKEPALYDWCKDGLLKKRTDKAEEDGVVFSRYYKEIDATPWLAKEAYQYHFGEGILNQYLLCYEDRIIEIDFNWEPTEEQMRIVAEKLAR